MTELAPAFVSPSQPLAGFFAELAQRFAYWRERRRWIAEMANVASLGHPGAILADIGLDRAQLDVLMTGPVDAGRQLDAMVAGMGTTLEHVPPAVLRDAEWTCTVCPNGRACAHWLRNGEWMGDGDPRCPNEPLRRDQA
ncbi:MAG TPA: hypothetical protein VLX67_02025 [Stellaceae bacterium]|nr:hypothetical protein [Stellaceae bacterium]